MEAKGDPKGMPKEALAPKSVQGVSGTAFFMILEALGPVSGCFLGGLEGSLGRQVGAKWVPNELWEPTWLQVASEISFLTISGALEPISGHFWERC